MHDGCLGAKCLAFVLSGALVPSWELGTPVEAQGLAAAHPQPDSPLPLAVLFPDGQAVGEKIFKTAGAVKSYSDAEQLCREAKGQLASPRSSAENEAVTQMVRAQEKNAYLSMNDISTEGRFTYPTGEILVYSNWADGEPNNNNAGQPENCVQIYREGKWNDIPCSEPLLVICEF